MKVKPYRACDICGQQYEKGKDCLKIKVGYDGWDFWGDYQPPWFSKIDICPDCSREILREVEKRRRK